MTLKQILEDYYKTTGRVWPDDFDDAMHFADTEKAEALEIYLARKTHYVRNHPENKPKWDKERFAEELGDFLMMIQVAGMAEGVDPLDALIKKLNRKANKDYSLLGYPFFSNHKKSMPPLLAEKDSLINPCISNFASQIEERLKEIFYDLKLNSADPEIITRCKWVRYQNDIHKTAFMFDGIKLLEYEMTDSGFKITTPARA